MMKPVRLICLVIFIAVVVLFTVGYASLPIMNASPTVNINIPTNLGNSSIFTIPNNINIIIKFYIDKFTTKDNITNTSSSITYESLGGTIAQLFQVLLYTCISATLLTSTGIIISFLGLKFISKLVFILALLAMIIIFSIMIILITDNVISNAIKNAIIPNIFGLNITNNTINYDTGFIMMSVATGLMFVNYIIYNFLG
jgi:hypothetical protein